MKKCVLIFVFLIFCSVEAQSILGKWKTVDPVNGESKSIVEIYKQDDKFFGKIVDILNVEYKDALCKKCEGAEKNKPVLGLVLIKNMVKVGEYFKKGTIFDPEQGKKFKCSLKLTEDPNILQVRGYIAFLYATQYWERIID